MSNEDEPKQNLVSEATNEESSQNLPSTFLTGHS